MKEQDPFGDRPEEVFPAQSTPDFSELQGADGPTSYVNPQSAAEAAEPHTHTWGDEVGGELEREKDIEQSPERYWGDVNRYCGEILAGLPVSVGNLTPLIREEDAIYMWPAQEEGLKAILHKQTYRFLGRFTVTHYNLGLSRAELNAVIIHFIHFNPDRNVIKSVHDDSYSGTEKKTLLQQAKILRENDKMAKETGIALPTEEDYELLRDELRRGAQFRSFEVEGDDY